MTSKVDVHGQIVAAIAEARQTMPWPEKRTLRDGSLECSGLTPEERDAHIAREVIRALVNWTVTPEQRRAGAIAAWQAESAATGRPADKSQLPVAIAFYEAIAEAAFRGILEATPKG